MNTNPEISVIIAVYNAELYIRKCIESLLNQTFNNFEVILINDGSIDSSGNICDEYALSDDRIRVHHQVNSGVGATRNVGLSLSKGIYCIHVDSDDYLECNMLEKLWEQVKFSYPDMVVSNYFLDFNANNKGQKILRVAEKVNSENLYDKIVNRQFDTYLWNKLIKTKLIFDSSVRFDVTCRYCEDFLFFLDLSPNIQSIEYVDMPLYNYVIQQGSLTTSLSKENMQSRMNFIKMLEARVEDDSRLLNCLYKFQFEVKLNLCYSNKFTNKFVRKIYPKCLLSLSGLNRNIIYKLYIFIMFKYSPFLGFMCMKFLRVFNFKII